MKNIVRLLFALAVLVSGAALHAAGSVRVNLSPAAALSAGAQWRLDGGAWQSSGATVKGVSAGSHTIDYKPVSGWITPAATSVVVRNGNTATVTASYVQVASLTIALTPSTGQWRLNGGAWRASGSSAGNLAPGSYSIEYAALADHTAPPAEVVTLAAGQNLALARAYVALGRVTITLTPAAAQWRLDGGAWQASGATVAQVTPGTHLIDYSPVADYETPASESVLVGAGAVVSLSRAYVSSLPVFAVIKAFSDSGAYPSIVAASDGKLYVATNAMGSAGGGQIFRVNHDGTGYQLLKVFPGLPDDGVAPNSLLEGSDGVLYGTTFNGGGTANTGTLFKMNKDGSGYTVLRRFDVVHQGTGPNSLVEGQDGFLYGTTSTGGHSSQGAFFKVARDGSGYTVLSPQYSWGGSAQGIADGNDGFVYGTSGSSPGSVFKASKDGLAFSTLKAFTGGSDGATPRGAVLVGSDGALYGTTSVGGTVNRGLLYRINRDGSGYTVLHHFLGGTDGGRPTGRLVEDAAGYLYGTTFGGGTANRGTVYRLKKDGSEYTIVRSLAGGVEGGWGSTPVALAGNGVLVGGTSLDGADTWGTIYKVNVDGSGFAVVRALGAPDGAIPISPVIEAGNGALYGTTYAGGGSAKGTVYRVNKDGSAHVVLRRFAATNDGANPIGGVIEASDGRIYGATLSTVFRMEADGTGYTTLRTFNDANGSSIQGGVIEGSDGFLYGATGSGGTAGFGTVYRLNKDGSVHTLLHSFAGAAGGSSPYGRVMEANNGRLYGTTLNGGSANGGTVFTVNKDGTGFAVLHHFAGGAADGKLPYAALTQGTDGRLYGTTTEGGAANGGTVYRLNLDGSEYTVIKAFAGGDDGLNPYYAAVTEAGGRLYGTTAGGGAFGKGVLYSMNPNGSAYQVRINFGTTMDDAATPAFGLTRASDGSLYGTTAYGAGGGSVYRFRPE